MSSASMVGEPEGDTRQAHTRSPAGNAENSSLIVRRKALESLSKAVTSRPVWKVPREATCTVDRRRARMEAGRPAQSIQARVVRPREKSLMAAIQAHL